MKINQLLSNFKNNIKADIDDSGANGHLTESDFNHIRDIINESINRAIADLSPAEGEEFLKK